VSSSAAEVAALPVTTVRIDTPGQAAARQLSPVPPIHHRNSAIVIIMVLVTRTRQTVHFASLVRRPIPHIRINISSNGTLIHSHHSNNRNSRNSRWRRR